MNWYALFVELGKEEVVKKKLDYYFDPETLYSFIPKRKILERKNGHTSYVIKKMFPSYVLIRTKMRTEIFHVLQEIEEVHRLLNTGAYFSKDTGVFFSKIDDEEMRVITKLAANNGIVDSSKIYIEGSGVHVESGPLKGLENSIKKIDRRKKRAKIKVNFMGKESTFDVSVEISKCKKQ
ncbi:antiterminator LoaP [Marininema halotolerans]|uniref:Transcription termination/antitermination protein NusG n=1 Tax=Marininema halotolerans TaxID=1155944 RepID=A0A1I6PQX2_9BACL|nr:antiterminator LoaP [Marininema halotolerans]SFS42607.1 transcriptional antiterminator NusG [Marininema halotolerans]